MPKVWINGQWTDADPDYAPNVFISATAPDNPIIGTVWLNSSINVLTIWNGSSWVSTGATGGGSDTIFYTNSKTITTNYSVPSNTNAMSAGPITINNGITVTVPSGSVWTVV